MIYKLVIFIISLTFFFSCNSHNNAESVDNLVEQLSIQKNKLNMVEVMRLIITKELKRLSQLILKQNMTHYIKRLIIKLIK